MTGNAKGTESILLHKLKDSLTETLTDEQRMILMLQEMKKSSDALKLTVEDFQKQTKEIDQKLGAFIATIQGQIYSIEREVASLQNESKNLDQKVTELKKEAEESKHALTVLKETSAQNDTHLKWIKRILWGVMGALFPLLGVFLSNLLKK